jgi:hypothetical protein
LDLRGSDWTSNIPRCLGSLCDHLRLLLGFGLGWIPALILALLVAVATIFLWPLVALALLYVIYSASIIHPESLTYMALFIGVIAIATIWWWHVIRHNNP